MADNTINETPSMAKVLRDAIDARLLDVHTGLPAEIVKYDAATQMADVQPLLQRKYVKEILPTDLPIISNVPVLWPRAGQAFIHFPLKPKDPVFLVFSERSIDRWKLLGGKVDPKDTRKFALSDAVAIPGMHPKSDPMIGVNDTDVFFQINPATQIVFKISGEIEFTSLTTKLTLKPTGQLSVTNPLGELVSAISQLFTDIGTAVTYTALGPQPLVMPTFVLDKLILDSFKS